MSLDLDLADFTLPGEAVLEIRKKNGERSGWRWRMAGPGHPATIAADDRQMKRFLDRSSEQERARVNGKKWKGDGETPEEMRARQVEYIVARVLGWNEDMTMGGSPFPCTPENVRTILANQGSDIYDQATEFLRDEQAFTKGSPTP
jgi:hypothetical protein